MAERDTRALHLAGARVAAQLAGELDHLTERGRAEGLALRQQPAARVDRQGASTLDEVDEAVLQPGGSITVTLQPGAQDATAADVARLEAKLDTLIARSS